ncbi:MAG TPA: ATPase, partial [Chloroflexi bacterium]|nr:ATPase [Chloroflexota bacterium]
DARLVAYGRHTYTGGQAAMHQILATGAPFTALLASNDESALGAMQTLRTAGRRIPDDVAVIGFDDRLESAVQTPPLTSVHLPLFQMGVQAVERLLAEMRRDADRPDLIEVRTRLVTRASCGCQVKPEWPAAPIAPAQHETVGATPPTWEATVQAMSAAVLTEAQTLHAEHATMYCGELLAAFRADVMQPDGGLFEVVLQKLLEQTIANGDDAQIWQPALTLLRRASAQLLTAPALQTRAEILLDRGRALISASMWQQHRRFAVDTRWMQDRIGLLTARLLTALDAGEIFAALAQHLPAMQVHDAWLAEFEAEADAPPGAIPEWSRLRAITTTDDSEIRFRNVEFPPPPIRNADAPFSLALLPLVGPRGQRGYVAFASTHLTLYGAIVQQMAAAFNTAQLYREATEGRRLAEEANRMKSRFLSTVSHELRTPLNLIVGTSAILLQESDEQSTPLPPQIHRDIERIHGSAQHLAGLIGDVLDLASSDAGRLRLTNEYVDLGQALRIVEEAGRRLAADKGIGWHADIPAAGPWVWGDRTRLRQVALNLVNNAVKFTARGGVTLRVETTPATVTVSVSDTGIGIHPEEQAALFAEFHRTERTIARGYGGLGLGLAISKRLVELHGGTIGVESSGEEGAGATFYFTLPLANAPVLPVAAPTRASTTPTTDAATVLMLTTTPSAGAPLASRLTQAGFQVEQTPLEGLATWLPRMAAGACSAVVLDAEDTSASSWRILKTIKENPATRELPVLFYTANDQQGALLEVDYLTKPIALTELTRALDQHWVTPASSEHRRTILVVDDDPETLDLHARIVQTHAATNRVLRAANGREALELLRQTSIDLMLLDLMMPDIDGFEVLEAMRTQPSLRDVPVIVVTGQTLTEAEIERLNQGVATILRKGLYSLDETLAHLEAALAHRRKLSLDAQRLVRRAMAFLHAHYAEPLTRQEIARHVGLDEDYLTYCFRQELGLTPIAYLNRYRVNQAKHLLKHSDKSITTVALEVGFADSGYFSRIFRREVGLSPDAYRRGA